MTKTAFVTVEHKTDGINWQTLITWVWQHVTLSLQSPGVIPELCWRIRVPNTIIKQQIVLAITVQLPGFLGIFKGAVLSAGIALIPDAPVVSKTSGYMDAGAATC